jgi:hypothetical protein
MHHSINPEEIKAEIEKLGHTVSNIWITKQYKTKLLLSMFLFSYNQYQPIMTYEVEYIQQCKIKFEAPKHKKDIAQCANYQRYGHTKNYCCLKPRCAQSR